MNKKSSNPILRQRELTRAAAAIAAESKPAPENKKRGRKDQDIATMRASLAAEKPAAAVVPAVKTPAPVTKSAPRRDKGAALRSEGWAEIAPNLFFKHDAKTGLSHLAYDPESVTRESATGMSSVVFDLPKRTDPGDGTQLYVAAYRKHAK